MLAVVASAASAQTGTGVITGAAIDSLRGGVLAGAQVNVDGTRLIGIVGSDGSFVIDSVPAGTQRLRLLHPVLDTIGLRVLTPALEVRAGDTTSYTVALPGQETIVRTKCGLQITAEAPAGLFGIVVDAGGSPVPGAQVMLSWTDLRIGRDGVRRTPQQRLAETGDDGRFRLCLLPPELNGDITAREGADTVGPVSVAFGRSLVSAHALVLAAGGRALLRGTVRTMDGGAIAGARVTVFGGTEATVTDSAGRFALDNQPAGTRTLVVRRIGYQPVELPVHLSPDAPEDVTVTMTSHVPVLAAVLVQRRMEMTLERVGFHARRSTGLGRYMGPDEIDGARAVDMVDLLRRFTPLRVVSTELGGRMIVGRPSGFEADGCVNYFVDNQAWVGDGAPIDHMLPTEIGAIEVYAAAYTPAEYHRPLQNCDTVVIWTRYRLDRG